MKYIIIEIGDLLIKTDADNLKEVSFTVQTPDYMMEFMNFGGTELKVSNAMNGYGYNCREDFAGKEVNIYHPGLNTKSVYDGIEHEIRQHQIGDGGLPTLYALLDNIKTIIYENNSTRTRN